MDPSVTAVRSFVAVVLPLELAATLNKKARHHVSEELSDQMRWVGPQHYHVTLSFLGNQEPAQLARLASLLQEKLHNWNDFHCMTGSGQLFPNNRRPRLLALEVHSGGQLPELRELVNQALVELGLEAEQAPVYRPHITLARMQQGHRLAGRPAWALPGFKLTVGDICVMQSTLSESGPKYSVLHRIPLGRALAASA